MKETDCKVPENISQPHYCVTAVNILTGDREIVTPPLSYDKAKETIKQHKERLKESDSKVPYILPRLSIFRPQTIFYKQ